MKYTFTQVSDIIKNAVIRANWKNFGVSVSRFDVSVVFSDLLIENAELKKKGTFYKRYTCSFDPRGSRYSVYDDDTGTSTVTENDWFTELDNYFYTICGIHLIEA